MTRLLLSSIVLFCLASTANALTLTATWDPTFPDPVGFGSTGLNTGTAFSVEFDDDNDNGLFDIAEQDSFSGISFLSFPGDPGVSRDLLLQVVAIPGVAADSGLLGNTGWVFGATASDTFTTISPGAFTYELEDDGISAVPAPAALPLLLGALGLFGFAARSRSRAV